MEMKQLTGIQTEIPKDMDLTEQAFDVLRKAEKEGLAVFDIDSASYQTVEQITRLCYCGGGALFLLGDSDITSMTWDPTEGEVNETIYADRYVYLTRSGMKQAQVP